jgi:hypothetical protein
MSLVTACGAECGIVTAGLGTAINRHWSTVAGAVAIEASVVRSGARSFKFAANATTPMLQRTFAASKSVAYFRAYFQTSASPPSSDVLLMFPNNNGGSNPRLTLRATTGVLDVSHGGATGLVAGPTLAANTWYGVEMEIDLHANPRVIRWRTWDAAGGWVSRGDSSAALAADTFSTTTSFSFGICQGPSSGLSVYFDDVLIGVGTTAGEDYDAAVPKGGKVLRYKTNADGTHSAFTTGDFKYNNTTNFANSATDVNTYLDDADQTSIADGYINQNVAGAGKYIRVAFEDEATEASPRAVAVTSTHHSSGTTANEHHLRVSDNGSNWTNVWGDWGSVGDDISDTTAHFRHKVLAAKPSTGAWTQGAINSLQAEWGNSDNVGVIPFVDSIALEVEWTETTNRSGTGTVSATIALAGSGSKATSGTATVAGASALAGSGRKAATGAGTVSGASALAGSGRKAGAGSGALLAGTTVLAGDGRKAGRGTGAVALTVTLAGTGSTSEAHEGTASVTLTSLVAGTGRKGGVGAGTVALVSVVAGGGRKIGRGTASVSIASILAGAGTKAATGTAAVAILPTLSGNGSTRRAGSGSISLAVALAGLGKRLVRVHVPRIVEVQGVAPSIAAIRAATARVVGSGTPIPMLASIANPVPHIAASDSPRPVITEVR